ncbi:uncharacterized protein LOC141659360 [Apium graveolens]|uniref:uncharacterized protein LOC141659360 n=1 Tax=Apium graveolens TaxID=4045 RepID=UPI003D7A1FA9
MRSDHGTEFFNSALNSLLADRGIAHQASCIGTPAQNGRVERKHRQLLSIARAIRFQSGLPIIYWGQCIQTACHIINRLPTPVLDHKTHFLCLYGKEPDYTQLRVFGCLCFSSVHEGDKFGPRAIRSIFLGYPLDHKGSTLLNLDTKEIFISRHVVFHESKFPFPDAKLQATPNDPYCVAQWLDSSDSLPTDTGIFNLETNSTDTGTLKVAETGEHFFEDTTCSDFSDWHGFPPDVDTLVHLQPVTDFLAESTEHFVQKSTRDRKPPAWWSDYQTHNVQILKPIKYHILSFISTASFSPAHSAFMTTLIQTKEPNYIAQAIQDP